MISIDKINEQISQFHYNQQQIIQIDKQKVMQFSKAQKVLHDTNNFNPPPGYYSFEQSNNSKPSTILNTNFDRQSRFGKHQQVTTNPGPGYYYNDKSERVRKRIIQEAKRKQAQFKTANATQSEIKISSIPSIPKKSTTRVYEELAPGILILHEEQNQATNIGPGSYSLNSEIGHKRAVAHKINPEHKKKNEIYHQPEIKIPTIAEQIRNQKRQMYKKNLVKSTGVNKNMISPSDLCLEVIILREKLLRSEQNPPPGYYYNEKYQSSFKQPDNDLLPQYQLMMGKEQRFKDMYQEQVGPGAYQVDMQGKMQGGYIARSQKQTNNNKNPGPGSYKIESFKSMEPVNPKGNCPPIFGSGNSRTFNFGTQINETPGPGSYTVQKSKHKKQKYIKIKKNFYESQLKPYNREENKKQLVSFSGDKSRSQETSHTDQRKKQKNNHYFKSKVDRFSSKSNDIPIGPGEYNTNKEALKLSFNKHLEYTGSKQPRFDDTKIRPHLGPGAYFKFGQST